MIRRIFGIFVMLVTAIPVLALQFIHWLIFGKTNKYLDKYMDYIHYNFISK